MPSSQVMSRREMEKLMESMDRMYSKHPWDRILSASNRTFRSISTYIQEHPHLFRLQAIGVATLLGSFLVTPILGAIGFSAVGPVLGSAAAAWQASIGNVAAGSLFAFCQSATMGGAAASVLAAVGAVGGAVAVVSTAFAAVGDFLKDIGGRIIDGLWSLKFW